MHVLWPGFLLMHFALLLNLFALMNQEYRIAKTVQVVPTGKDCLYNKPSIEGTKRFAEALINEYRTVLHQEVHPSFKDKFPLWKARAISAKTIGSSFSEALLYLYPSDDLNVLFVDCIDVPVQVAFFNGLINLDAPEKKTRTDPIKILLPLEEARREYAKWPTSIVNASTNIRVSGRGTLRLVDTQKLVTQPDRTVFGIYAGGIEIDNRGPSFVRTYGKPVSFRLNLKGPLLFASEKDFALELDEAKKLGRAMAEIDIKQLFVESEFFRQALAHGKLRPIAEAIIEKKARSEKDPAYYPLWQFKMDVQQLKDAAKDYQIDATYVDELLTWHGKAVADGHLLWYYPNPSGFMWQWMAINAALLALLVLLESLRVSGLLPIPRLLNENAIGQTILPLIILAINAWVFRSKPDAVSLPYWILPGLLFFFDIAMSLRLSRSV